MNNFLAVVLSVGALWPGMASASVQLDRTVKEIEMKRTLVPVWSADEIAAGEGFADRWKTFAASATGDGGAAPIGAGQAKVAEVLARHEARLMTYPGVVAVADGICQDGPTAGQPCITVFVAEKIDPETTTPEHRVPDQLDGVPVQVIVAGEIGILPRK